MTKLQLRAAALCLLVASTLGLSSASAQNAEVKEKPPMYSWLSDWAIPRAKWGDVDKSRGAVDKILSDAVANGTLVGYGSDTVLVHTNDGATHDTWWSSMSMAGLLKVLEEIHKSGASVTAVLQSATKHTDAIYVARYYNWRSGALKGFYTRSASYKLKADAPDNAVDMLSKSFMVPLLEKLLAAGTLAEYEIDELAIHSEAPGSFYVVLVCPSADGLDKVDAALRDTIKSNPLASSAFGSMVDFTAHRDYLSRTDGVYK
jgi:hypothetical protein